MPIYAAGTIINSPSVTGTHFLQGGRKRPIPSQGLFDALFAGRDCLTIPDPVFAAITDGYPYADFLDGTILQDSTTGGRYVVDGLQRRPIPNQYSFDTLFGPGTLRNAIKVLSPFDLGRIPLGPAAAALAVGQVPTYSQYAAGTIINSPSVRGTHFLQGGRKRPIPSQGLFDALFSGRDWLTIPDAVFAAIPDGDPYADFPDGTILQDSTTGGRYVVDNLQRRPIPNQFIFDSLFGNGTLRNSIKILAPYDLGRVAQGPPLPHDIVPTFPIQFHDESVLVENGTEVGSAHMETNLSVGVDGSISGSLIYKNDSVWGWCGGIVVGVFDTLGHALAGFAPPSGCVVGKGVVDNWHEHRREVAWADVIPAAVMPRARQIRVKLYATTGDNKLPDIMREISDVVSTVQTIAQAFGTDVA